MEVYMYLVNLCFPGCLNENDNEPIRSIKEARKRRNHALRVGN